MGKQGRTEIWLTDEELAIIMSNRRKKSRRFIKKQRSIQRKRRIAAMARHKMEPSWQRFGGTILTLFGLFQYAISYKIPDNGEVLFSSVLCTLFGLIILITKHNLINEKN